MFATPTRNPSPAFPFLPLPGLAAQVDVGSGPCRSYRGELRGCIPRKTPFPAGKLRDGEGMGSGNLFGFCIFAGRSQAPSVGSVLAGGVCNPNATKPPLGKTPGPSIPRHACDSGCGLNEQGHLENARWIMSGRSNRPVHSPAPLLAVRIRIRCIRFCAGSHPVQHPEPALQGATAEPLPDTIRHFVQSRLTLAFLIRK